MDTVPVRELKYIPGSDCRKIWRLARILDVGNLFLDYNSQNALREQSDCAAPPAFMEVQVMVSLLIFSFSSLP